MKIAFILLISLLSLNCMGQSSDTSTATYWKRYASIDLLSAGPVVSLQNNTNNDQYYSLGIGAIHIGLTKFEHTPFLNFSIDTKYPLPIFSLHPKGRTEVAARAGVLLLKNTRFEGSIASGIGYFGKNEYASSNVIRFIYKPIKWVGIGINYYLNFNNEANFSAFRVSLSFNNGL